MGTVTTFPLPHPGFPTAAKSLQSCPTLWDPIDGSPPGSPVPGILQASGPSSRCVWNPRVFADDARGWQCPFVLCLQEA